MRKWLSPILIIIAIALLSDASHGYAYAPLIKDIPEIWIGDSEDNVGQPVDLNFFRFTDAFNFDQYVFHDPHDDDQSTTNVRWSFLADSANLVTINGIETLSDATEALNPELVGKELTSYPNNNTPHDLRATSYATFRDIHDSPTTSEPPYPSPTSGSELNTIITIFASNGTKYSSKQVLVRANLINGVDIKPSPPWPEPTPPAEDWTKLYPTDGMFINAFDGSFYIATQLTFGGSIGASGDATRSVWSYWKSPTTEATYVANQVYRAKYTIRTTQTNQNNVPNMRMLLYCTDSSGNYAFAGGNRLGKGPNAPTTVPYNYNIYFCPNDVSSLIPEIKYVNLSWELIDFALDEEGTNYLDDVWVERFTTPDKSEGTAVTSFQGASGFANWTSFKLTQVGTASFYGDVTFAGGGTNTFISIQTPGPVEANGHVNWGQWSIGSTSGVTFTAGKLYRTVYTLSAIPAAGATQGLGKVRLINNTIGGQWSAEIDIDTYTYTAQQPSPTGTEYSVWQESPAILYSGADADKNVMTFLFDVSDGQANQGGTTVMSKVEVYTYDIP